MELQPTEYQMSYQVYGSGIPLVFIHGFPLNSSMWSPQIEAVSDIAKVITPDIRGFGKSKPTKGVYQMDLLASDINTLLDQLSINIPVILCGLSMGGYIAMAFCRHYPEKVAGLILTATRMTADSNEVKANRDKNANLVMTSGINPIIENMLPMLLSPISLEREPDLTKHVKNIMLDCSREGVHGALLGMKERQDSTEALHNMNTPALVIHGEMDRLIPIEEAESMVKTLSQGQLIPIPEAGHLPNLEQPQIFNRAIRDFLVNLTF